MCVQLDPPPHTHTSQYPTIVMVWIYFLQFRDITLSNEMEKEIWLWTKSTKAASLLLMFKTKPFLYTKSQPLPDTSVPEII